MFTTSTSSLYDMLFAAVFVVPNLANIVRCIRRLKEEKNTNLILIYTSILSIVFSLIKFFWNLVGSLPFILLQLMLVPFFKYFQKK